MKMQNQSKKRFFVNNIGLFLNGREEVFNNFKTDYFRLKV